MGIEITKIQFLSHRDSGHPIFYCHANDKGHSPQLRVANDQNGLSIYLEKCLFKIKKNPQTKNRIDIYMPISSAHELGAEILNSVGEVNVYQWFDSNANPQQNAGGRMALPEITWSKYGKAIYIEVDVDSGTHMEKYHGYVNIDLEKPHSTHIMMRDEEIHIGISLELPVGRHDENRTTAVNVPEEELQRGTDERNPIQKVLGTFSMLFDHRVAAGLGQLLINV